MAVPTKKERERRKKKQEPKKFYIMTDEFSGEFDISGSKEELQQEMSTRLAEDPETGRMQIFEAVEMHFEVENNPKVTIGLKKEN